MPVINALAHVIVSEGLTDDAYVEERCDLESWEAWKKMILKPENSPEAVAEISGVDAETIRAAARLYGSAKNSAIYYGLGVTEHSQGSTMVMGMANLAMATGNIGRLGVGVNPLRGQNNVQGSCDMGSFPHELAGYRPVADDDVRGSFEKHWGIDARCGARLSHSQHVRCRHAPETSRACISRARTWRNRTRIRIMLKRRSATMECIVVQDLFLNETAKFAHVFLPGTSFLEKDGTFTNAERRINRVRPVDACRGRVRMNGRLHWRLAQAMGYEMHYDNVGRGNHGRNRRTDADVPQCQFQDA